MAASLRDELLRRTPLSVRRHWWYLRVHHRWLNLRKPETFTEKLCWRMVKDRRPILLGTCDKLGSKAYALEQCHDLPLRVPRTYWSGTDVAELGDVELPAQWVLKPNHRSGLVLLETGTPDIASLRSRTSGWLKEWNWAMLGEWAHVDTPRVFLAEERLGAGGPVPPDYKIFVFDGKPRLIGMNCDRFTQFAIRYYTPEWEPLPHRMGAALLAPVMPRPPELPTLLDIAGRLGEPFDFMRVDLYVDGGDVVFGELTPYSGSGFQTYDPPDLDATLGGFWQLPELTR